MLLFPKLFKIDYLISLNVTFNSDIFYSGDIFFYYIKFYFYLSGKKLILKICQKKKKLRNFETYSIQIYFSFIILYCLLLF